MRAKRVLGVEFVDPAWLRTIRDPVPPGKPAGKLISIPQDDARLLLRSVVRRVADLPADSSPQVVWTNDTSELLVHTDTISIRCTEGMVNIGLRVACDQVPKAVTLSVPLAVGTREAPAGLVMSTFTRLSGPPVITALWSQAVTAFAWEALVELARSLAAAVGKDVNGRPLVPGMIGAGANVLLIQPMARHNVSLKAVR